MPAWLAAIPPSAMPELSDRDSACIVLADLDYEAQLIAIHGLLDRHRKAEALLAEEIKEIEAIAEKTSGLRNEAAVSELTDRFHSSVYQDAAHSMAAVGMLAPFVESLFYHAFRGIQRQMVGTSSPLNSHGRWQQPAEDQWDCHFVWANGRRSTNLVQGINQLADAVGLLPHLPADLIQTLDALFAYRNKMFHCGFEWTPDERVRFQKRLDTAGWPRDWFAKATSGGEPWIFYLTEAFVRHCMERIEQVIVGIGAFCKVVLMPAPRKPEGNP
jgi:hypothetical protein